MPYTSLGYALLTLCAVENSLDTLLKEQAHGSACECDVCLARDDELRRLIGWCKKARISHGKGALTMPTSTSQPPPTPEADPMDDAALEYHLRAGTRLTHEGLKRIALRIKAEVLARRRAEELLAVLDQRIPTPEPFALLILNLAEKVAEVLDRPDHPRRFTGGTESHVVKLPCAPGDPVCLDPHHRPTVRATPETTVAKPAGVEYEPGDPVYQPTAVDQICQAKTDKLTQLRQEFEGPAPQPGDPARLLETVNLHVSLIETIPGQINKTITRSPVTLEIPSYQLARAIALVKGIPV